MLALRKARVTGWRRHTTIRLTYVEDGSVGQLKTTVVSVDFVFRKYRLAIFVDGCFWHRCPWHGTIPRTRHAFWKNKLLGNVQRDKLVNRLLRLAGWRVLRIWEHQIQASPPNCVTKVKRFTAETPSVAKQRLQITKGRNRQRHGGQQG